MDALVLPFQHFSGTAEYFHRSPRPHLSEDDPLRLAVRPGGGAAVSLLLQAAADEGGHQPLRTEGEVA